MQPLFLQHAPLELLLCSFATVASLILQVAYFICCRFLKTSTFHPRVFRGNKVIFISVPVTIAIMVS